MSDGNRAYTEWQHMIRRAVAADEYPRGVQQSWRQHFSKFFDDMGQPPEGKKLKRRDPHKAYTSDNCFWG